MDLKLFASTFLLIFLAELGDKTQLAAMAAAAGTKSPLSIFAGAVSALILSTLIAVVAGVVLQRFLPPIVLKTAAAVLFLFFGVVLLVNVIQERKSQKDRQPTTSTEHVGTYGKIVLKAAEEFEQATINMYQQMVAQSTNSGLRDLFSHLYDEEQAHLNHIKLLYKHKIESLQTTQPKPGNIKIDISNSKEMNIVNKILEHEKYTMSFYQSCAQRALIPEVKHAFEWLAQEENSHIEHINDFIKKGTFNSDHKKI